MVRLLSIILTIILFPPAVLAVISNNAVPGDSTYPVKRSLENIIVVAASINPNTKAAFSQTRSNTRYKEFSTLIAQGKETTNALNELVDQTDLAVSQLSKVTDPVEKAKLIAQLSLSIEKYDKGLQDVSSSSQSFVAQEPSSDTTTLADNGSTTLEVVTEPSVSEPSATPVLTAIGRALATAQPTSTLRPATPGATATPRPAATSSPRPVPTVRPTSIPTSTPQGISSPTATPRPAATPRATVVPTSQVTPRPTSHPTPTPTPDPSEGDRRRQREIEEARKKLEELQEKLKKEREKAPAAVKSVAPQSESQIAPSVAPTGKPEQGSSDNSESKDDESTSKKNKSDKKK